MATVNKSEFFIELVKMSLSTDVKPCVFENTLSELYRRVSMNTRI